MYLFLLIKFKKQKVLVGIFLDYIWTYIVMKLGDFFSNEFVYVAILF